MKQAIDLPKSSSGILYEQLGYLESFDAVVDQLYAFLVYKETRTDNSKWVIRIKSSVTAGAVFDPDNLSLQNAVQKAHAHKEKYVVWGFNMVPKGDDSRLVENRIFYNEKGEPSKLEVHLVTRDNEGKPLPEKVATIDWPGAAANDAKPDNGFMAFFDKYNQACLTKNSAFLRSILPADIPDDEFEFVLNMSHGSALAIDASGVKPTFKQTGNMMVAIYEGDLGDGMTSFIMDFYWHNNQWLKYNPDE